MNNEFNEEELNPKAMAIATMEYNYNKQCLDTIKSQYNFYKQLLYTFISISIALLALTLGFDSMFCKCKTENCAAEICTYVSVAICCVHLIIMIVLTFYNRKPKEKIGSELRDIFNNLNKAIDYLNKLNEQYNKLIERTKNNTIIGLVGFIFTIIISVISIII